jgi:hypothetical protein
MSDTEEAVVCSQCGVTRTDEPDYSAIQPMTGQPLGWYSGDDGEICPKDIAELMATSNLRTYAYHLPGGGVAST